MKACALNNNVRYQPPQANELGLVWINDRQYFAGVPESGWKFPIGGYLPAQRWLKDRIVVHLVTKSKPIIKVSSGG